jgi:hypothetical protein
VEVTSCEYILMEKRHAKREVRKSFCEIQDAAVKKKIGAVQCIKCQSDLRYSTKKVERSI